MGVNKQVIVRSNIVEGLNGGVVGVFMVLIPCNINMADSWNDALSSRKDQANQTLVVLASD